MHLTRGNRLNAIVTGCASGIGRCLADELARQGYRVLATDVNQSALEQTARELDWESRGIFTRQQDVREPAGWRKTIEQAISLWGELDLLCNVAGVIRPEFVDELSDENISLQIDVNTKGVIFGTKYASAVMIPQRRGHIINIASMAALAPIPGISIYTASKFAVRGFSLAVATELAEKGIYVSIVCPDAVDTPMVDYQLNYPAAALTFSGSRILRAEDVVRRIVNEVLPRRPVETAFPWSRATIARLSGLMPSSLSRQLVRLLSSKGQAKQRKILAQRPADQNGKP